MNPFMKDKDDIAIQVRREALTLQVPYESMVWLSVVPKEYFWWVFSGAK